VSLFAAGRFARLRLARTDRIGPVAFSQLLARFGSAARALDALPDPVRKSGAASIPPPVEAVERELGAGERLNARLLVLADPDGPQMPATLDPPRRSFGRVATRPTRLCVGVGGAPRRNCTGAECPPSPRSPPPCLS